MLAKLIVIEGSDGSGKGTQAHKLVEFFQKNMIPHLLVDFPRYDSFFGEFVACYLRGDFGSPKSIHPKLRSLPYALDRMEAADTIKTALLEGKIVICNRYTISSMAHQSTTLKSNQEKREFWQWLAELEYDRLGIPREDLVIFLDVPPKISKDLLHKKEKRDYIKGKALDVHEEDSEYLSLVHKTYLELAKFFPHWQVINCIDQNQELYSVQHIHLQIIKTLSDNGIIELS